MVRSDAGTTRPPLRWRIWPLVVLLVIIGIGYRWEQDHLANRREIARLTRELDIAQKTRDSLDVRLVQERKRADSYLQRVDQLEWEKRLVGQPITLTGFTLTGEPFEWSDYRGKVVLVEFWALPSNLPSVASHGEPIHPELPTLQQLYRDLNNQGFEIVGVNYDAEARHGEVRAFLDEKGVPWIHLARHRNTWPLVDGQGPDWLPLRILVDREGQVVSVFKDLTSTMIGRIKELTMGEAP